MKLVILMIISFASLVKCNIYSWKRTCDASKISNPELNLCKDKSASSNGAVNTVFEYSCFLENRVNQQIGIELEAFHLYMSMGHYFERADKDLPGFSKFFHAQAKEELEHAQKLMRYQHKRGAKIRYSLTVSEKNIPAEVKNFQKWASGSEALQDALRMEKKVTNDILCLHSDASIDADLQNFLESDYVPEQFESMKTLSNHVNTLERLSKKDAGLAEYQFDVNTLQKL